MDKFEKKTEEYFASNRFLMSRVPEGNKKTPDFENENILVEVKSIKPQELEGLHKDSTYNAIKNNLRDAARKFRDYDPKHTRKHIVVVYSSEIVKDDIYSVWTGEWSPEHRDRIFKGGMLLSDDHKKHIDGVAWFKKETDQSPKHVWVVSEDMRQYFPETIHD